MKKGTIKKMVFWSMISAGIIALFWTVWWLIAGSVPVTKEIRFSHDAGLDLPFDISRWWDILMGPFFSLYLVYLWSLAEEKDCALGINITGVILGAIIGSGIFLGDIEFFESFNLMAIIALYGGFEMIFEGENKKEISAMSSIFYLMVVGLIIGLANMLPTILIFLLLTCVVSLSLRKPNTNK